MNILTPDEIKHSGLTLSLGAIAVNIPKTELDALGSLGEWVQVTNEIIVQEGSYQKHLYTVLDGKVEIYKENQGNKETLITLGAGRCFGEISLLSGGKASASVMVEDKTILWRINHHHLMEFVEAYSSGGQICINLAKVLSDRLVHANERIVELSATK